MDTRLDWTVVDQDTGLVDLEQWNLRVLAGTSVGRCRCGDALMPEPPEQDRPNVTWLASACQRGHRVVQVAQRPVRSARRQLADA